MTEAQVLAAVAADTTAMTGPTYRVVACTDECERLMIEVGVLRDFVVAQRADENVSQGYALEQVLDALDRITHGKPAFRAIP